MKQLKRAESECEAGRGKLKKGIRFYNRENNVDTVFGLLVSEKSATYT